MENQIMSSDKNTSESHANAISDTPQKAVKTLLDAIENKTINGNIDKEQKIKLIPLIGTLQGIAEGKITRGSDGIKEHLLNLALHTNEPIGGAARDLLEHGVTVNGNDISGSPSKRNKANESLDTPQKTAQTFLDTVQARVEDSPMFGKFTKDREPYYALKILKGIAEGKITTGTKDITKPLQNIANWGVDDDKMHAAINEVFKHGIAIDGKDLSGGKNLSHGRIK